MRLWSWVTVLVMCVVAGRVLGCCGDGEEALSRPERAARWRHRNRRFRNGTDESESRRNLIRLKRGKLRIPIHRLKEIQDMDLTELLNSLRGASHPGFTSFIASESNTTVRPLLGAGSPTMLGASASSPLAMDLMEVASERRSVIKDAGCKPRKVPVQVPPPEDPSVLYTPSCVLLPRCSGCCGHELLECVPSEVKTIRKKVLALRFADDESISPDGQETSIKRVEMEKHVECECQCKVKKSNCSARQVYDAGNCRCLCPNEHEAASCPGTKIWSEADCACKCSKVDECSTGLEFDPVQCRCLPSPSRPLLMGAAVSPTSGGDGGEESRGSSGTAATPSIPAGGGDRDTGSVINTGGTASSGWGSATSSGVVADRPPPSRSRPPQPPRTQEPTYHTSYQQQPPYQSRYQPAYQPGYQPTTQPGYQPGYQSPYQPPSYADRRYDQDQQGTPSQYDRRYSPSDSKPRFDRRYGAADGEDRYRPDRYDPPGADSRGYDRRYQQQAEYAAQYADRRYG